MENYTKHPFEELTDAQLNDVLGQTGIPFTNDSQKRISDLFNEKKHGETRKRRARGKIIIPLIAILTLALVGFTQFDIISQLFIDAFGNREVGQYAESIDGISESQGIRMEILSGLHDGNSTYLFVSLTDETRTYNFEDMMFPTEQWSLSGFGGLHGVSCRMVRYESNTNTAYLLVQGLDGVPGKSATFKLKGFSSNLFSYDFEVPEINLSTLLSEHQATFNEVDHIYGFGIGVNDPDVAIEVALEKGELAQSISNFDRAIISNIGYRDGLLHIQLDATYDIYGERITPFLVHAATGEVVQNAYSMNYDGTIDYEEYVFKISDIDDLSNYILRLEGWYYAESIDGNWEVSFVTPQQMESITIPMEQSIGVGDTEVYIETLVLTPMSIHLSADMPAGASIEAVALYKDGTETSIFVLDDNTWLPFGRNTDPDNLSNQNITFTMPIDDFDNLRAIAINGQIIELVS